jgi:hypothetical protein
MKLDDNGTTEIKPAAVAAVEPNSVTAKAKEPLVMPKPDLVLKVPEELKVEENGSKSPNPKVVEGSKVPIITVPLVKPPVAEDEKTPMEVDGSEGKEKETVPVLPPTTTPASVPSPESKAAV